MRETMLCYHHLPLLFLPYLTYLVEVSGDRRVEVGLNVFWLLGVPVNTIPYVAHSSHTKWGVLCGHILMVRKLWL